MNLLDFFRASRPKSAEIAKERLQILVAHQRVERNRPSYLQQLQKELLEVVRKYVNVEQEAISVKFEQDDNQETLELNIVLPDFQPEDEQVKDEHVNI